MTRIPLWLDLRHVDDPAPFLAAADAAGCEAIVGHDIEVEGTRIVRDGTGIGRWVTMRSAADQEEAATEPGLVVIESQDWSIIPLENLIAARRDRPGSLFALAKDPADVARFRGTLEIGVHGIILRPVTPAAIKEAHSILETRGARHDDAVQEVLDIRLVPAEVLQVKDAGSGDRVCIDTTIRFGPGEGLLVGNTARSFALVHAETIESEYVRARPFRVNAGALHAYVIAAGGRTKYLSELGAGDQVTAVDPQGGNRIVTVGRAKIEHRPHTLVQWQGPSGPGGIVAQTAETIRFVQQDGTPIAITALQPGDFILIHEEASARHFGMPVKERLEER